MKNPFKPNLLPYLTMGAGGVGLVLRVWLFSLRDAKGLLPAGHVADVFTYLLMALFLGALFLCSRSLGPVSRYSRLFPASPLRAAGCWLGAAALVWTAVSERSGTGMLGIILMVLGILAALVLGYAGWCRLRGGHPSSLLYAAPTVYLMLHTVLQVRSWNSETQLSVYCFPLLASVFLMLAAYQHAVLALEKKPRSAFVFFGQAALFCCLLSLNGSTPVFYLGMAAWMGLDLCTLTLRQPKQEVQHAAP